MGFFLHFLTVFCLLVFMASTDGNPARVRRSCPSKEEGDEGQWMCMRRWVEPEGGTEDGQQQNMLCLFGRSFAKCTIDLYAGCSLQQLMAIDDMLVEHLERLNIMKEQDCSEIMRVQ